MAALATDWSSLVAFHLACATGPASCECFVVFAGPIGRAKRAGEHCMVDGAVGERRKVRARVGVDLAGLTSTAQPIGNALII